MFEADTPVIFSDGTHYFTELAKEYIRHDKGFFILAPSGTGKTHFIKNQADKHWIDGDILWTATHAHPDNPWWTTGDASVSLREVDFRSDIITYQALKQGFWVMGASNLWLRPDAIVLPDWETHVGYIEHREKNNYDGGATMDKLGQVLDHRARIESHGSIPNMSFRTLDPANNQPSPIFSSIDEAVLFLTNEKNS